MYGPMALDKFRAAPIPNPPLQWDAQYMRQVIRVLETYFSQLDSRAANNASAYTADNFYGGVFHGNGSQLYVPYNQFYSLTDQTIPAIDQAVAVQLENTSFTNGIYIAGTNDTEITFSEPGIYTLTVSLRFMNPTNDAQYVDIWFRYNNGTGAVDVPNSNSKFTIPPRKSASDPSYIVTVTPFTGFAEAADVYVELMWTTSDTSVAMEHIDPVAYSVGVTPAVPGTPSAIVQANFVSKPV
jgi:hypothetical protein